MLTTGIFSCGFIFKEANPNRSDVKYIDVVDVDIKRAACIFEQVKWTKIE